jgi:hypothetical protein
MRNPVLASAAAALFTVSIAVAQVAPSESPAGNSTSGGKGVQTDIQPGKVGPGSEKNSEVAPTSPTVPSYAQPPPEIPPAGSSSTGSSTGEQGKSAPYNPTSPGLR